MVERINMFADGGIEILKKALDFENNTKIEDRITIILASYKAGQVKEEFVN